MGAFLFSSRGRVNRKPYIISMIILGIVTGFFSCLSEGAEDIVIVSLVSVIVICLCSIVSILLTIRRFHDLNRSGWYTLLGFIPIVNFVVSLYLLCKRGTEGENKYGPDPLL
ncbi:DUF805 domain-containing protein [uncultured Megasphaera sp.]|uniref:DUF805 domain-containing protein n=1 Tax=uncultured Megasphaera sp. TaxID=165188 RepID=UPI0025988B86|nr:DUF805 domain-containing protein [uncultured Megasphaera sp.]